MLNINSFSLNPTVGGSELIISASGKRRTGVFRENQ